MVTVRIYGPNISFHDGATFHVHKDGCAHLRQQPYRSVRSGSDQGGDIIQAGTAREVVEHIYPPSDFEYDPDDERARRAYDDDVTIFPCTGL